MRQTMAMKSLALQQLRPGKQLISNVEGEASRDLLRTVGAFVVINSKQGARKQWDISRLPVDSVNKALAANRYLSELKERKMRFVFFCFYSSCICPMFCAWQFAFVWLAY